MMAEQEGLGGQTGLGGAQAAGFSRCFTLKFAADLQRFKVLLSTSFLNTNLCSRRDFSSFPEAFVRLTDAPFRLEEKLKLLVNHRSRNKFDQNCSKDNKNSE